MQMDLLFIKQIQISEKLSQGAISAVLISFAFTWLLMALFIALLFDYIWWYEVFSVRVWPDCNTELGMDVT